MNKTNEYNSLTELAYFFKEQLNKKKYILLYGYNGVGKTRLSYEFKSLNQEKNENDEKISSDTLYYNAFTEDLFFWDNDIEYDSNRKLMFNSNSKFFKIMKERDIDGLIREILHQFVNFDFTINYSESSITFNRTVYNKDKDINETLDNIKISRSEESLFILCFFLAIVDIVLKQNDEKSKSYEWVKYIYIDDPVSSLDDNNIIALAVYIAHLFKPDKDNKESNEEIKTIPVVISTHHALFHNVMWNELNKIKGNKYFLSYKKDGDTIKYMLEDIKDIPFFYHVAMLNQLIEALKDDKLYTYHFSILRNILEKTASFFGYTHFQECLKINKEKHIDNRLNDKDYYERAIQVLNHGGYSLFEPVKIKGDTKNMFSDILNLFLDNFKFNIEKEIIEKEDNNGK